MSVRNITRAASAAVGIMLASAASALTLINEDGIVYAVMITTDDGSTVVQVEPEQTLGDICSGGCTLSLENGVTDSFDGSENIVILDGTFSLLD